MQTATLNKQSKPIGVLTKVFILLIPVLIITLLAALFTNIFITLIICMLLALVLNPAVDYLESLGLNRTLSILTAYVLIAIILTFAFQLFIPNIVEQAASLQTSFKQFEFSDKLKDVERWLEKNIPYLKRGDVANQIDSYIKGSFTQIQGFISGVLSTAFLIFIIPFITFFILRDRQLIKKSFINLVPNKYFEMTVNIIDKIEKQLSRYVRGWLFDALFVGVLSGLGLSILGINNAVIIGIVAGAGHLIPYAGPIIGGIPAILISIIQFGDFHMVLPIVILFTIIYVLDNSIAQPYIFAKSVDMNPITIIALLLLGNELLGAFGALIAIPVASVLKVSARETINGIRNYKLGYY
ncbi:MAG: AI-2E family transporter [Ignavibacteria bacterium]